MIIRDQLILSIDNDLRDLIKARDIGVIYVYREETGEPEPGPSIEDIDLPEPLLEALKKRGIRRLYRFQYDAYKSILNGENVVITAGTGTGKTEAFLLPILSKIYEKRTPNPQAMLVYPTKALARDQLQRINDYLGYGVFSAAVYDGDTPRRIRQKISANPPDIVVTNPDMIHVGLVLSPTIRRFVKASQFMVIDELHVYEGVFGSNVKCVFERINKYRRNNPPQYIGSSATIGNPREHAETLFGVPVKVIEGPLRRRGIAYHVLVSAGKLSRWTVTAALASVLARRGLRFIVFVDSQQMAELIARIAWRSYGVDIMVHRAGLPADERKMIESKLRAGEISGVAATPTLELGIDIGFLDAVIMAAPPPSFAKYLQRAGRAGRRGRKGYVFTVLADDPIDAYYERNPKRYFEQEIPPLYMDPENEEVLRIHLLALLLEQGRIRRDELKRAWLRVAERLRYERLVAWVGPYIYPNYRLARKIFMEYMSIRGSGPQVVIYDVDEKNIVGYRELPQAVLDLHPDAVYLLNRRVYKSIEIDVDKKIARVKRLPDDTPYYTRPLYTVDLVDYSILASRTSSRGIPLAYAWVKLSINVEGYIVRNYWETEKAGIKYWFDHPITYTYNTKALLLKYPENPEWDYMSNAEAFHAIEHALISAARPVCGAALGEMGGISYPSGDIVIYDGAPGGSGLAKLLFERFEKAEEIAYEIVSKCDCEDGCPRCIYSPYCGNNNQVLSRRKATYVLGNILKRGAVKVMEPIKNRYGKPIV
ncbi:DEAD/DEAH box helicase domain protein [Staphylothermus marinus F1]|uniref:DEAD/DEAH box helicase domain protein n=2 Tax=Staphylothermus marinus TaxID=2280 RepID=A3DPM4_STAMF|nr:DEAD/DEAH box helicase domain protein [Staphylothermus marinus F1]